MLKLKYSKYEDFQQELTLRDGIADLTPYKIKLPDPPRPEEFINFGLPKEQQFFKFDDIPTWVTRFGKEMFRNFEERERLGTIINANKEYTDFIASQWNKRENGIWIYINGKPLYITGLNWFFLNHYKHIQKLDYRYEDMEYFYWWKFCVKDVPTVMGGMELARRQEGKCLEINTLCKLHNGKDIKVQDIVTGNLLTGDDGTPRMVVGTTSGFDEMYKVEFYNGESFTCNGAHVLALYFNKQSSDRVLGWEKMSYVTISVDEYMKLPDSKKKHLVGYCRGWGDNFKEQEHFIPPYLLGLWLGDGTQSNGNITNEDVEVIEYIKDFCLQNNFIHCLANKNLNRINRPVISNSRINEYREELKTLNVLNNKHIPSNYLIDSRKNRLELLAGLLDTDGYKTKNHYEIIQKNKAVADGVVELARSLGFYVTKKEKIARLKREGKPVYECLVYRILISGDVWEIPMKVARKKIEKHVKRNNPLNSGIRVTPVGKKQYFGFELDGNHLFILSNGIVTHNSTRAGVLTLEDITKGENKYCGLQSKDEQSITSFMSKCIVNPYNKLPFYFRPVNNSTKLAPKDKLEFRHPQDIEDSLMNTIEARANSLKAFDGETLSGYVEDEAGKQDKLLITEKWGVHRETLRVLGGKAIVTSTVEETTNGGMKEYQKLWDLSDHAEVNLLGETETGLVRYFRPSFQTIRFDRYGFSIVNDPTEEQYQFLLEQKVEQPRMGGKEFIDTKIESVKDSLDRAKLIRKYPRTIREAFRKSANNCEFDIIKLTQQQDKYLYKDSHIIGGNRDVIKGNLSWKDNIPDTEVIFTECENGRWLFNRAIFPYLKLNGNQVTYRGNNKYPLRQDLGCLGADAFKYGQTDEKRKSLGTICGYINYDMAIEDEYIRDTNKLDKLTDNIFLEYGWRQSSTDLYSEDCLMTSVFCGMPIFPEINVNCIVEHYMRRGYYGYLKFRKIWARLNGQMVAQTSNKPGMQTVGGEILNSLFNYVNDYIAHDIHRCVFPNTISDFIQVEKGQQKDYDYFVSSAYALYGAKNKKGKEETIKKEIENIEDPLLFI